MLSPKFKTTRLNSPLATRDEAKSLALAFAIVGRLVAEGFIDVDLSQPGWQDNFRHQVHVVAAEVHEAVKGGF